jgi:hypothetical protein
MTAASRKALRIVAVVLLVLIALNARSDRNRKALCRQVAS